MYYPINFVSPFATLFDCNDEFTPAVYVGGEEIEYNMSYNVKLKFVHSKPPAERKEGSMVSLYALLYRPLGERAIIKLGCVSTSSWDCAGLLWAQAPLHARIIGVFHLAKEIELEHIEEKCVEILKNDNSLNKRFKFTTKLPKTIKIINMWNYPEYLNINDYSEDIKKVKDILLNYLTKLEYLELLYYNDMWLEPPKLHLNIGGQISELNDLRKEKDRTFDGNLIVTPIGICIFNIKMNGQYKIYIDVARKFAYNTRLEVKEKKFITVA